MGAQSQEAVEEAKEPQTVDNKESPDTTLTSDGAAQSALPEPCWVSAEAALPAIGSSVLARSFNSYFFAGYSPWTGWVMLSNGREWRIEPPNAWQMNGAMAQQLGVEVLKSQPATSNPAPAAVKGQMLFDFSDSKVMSRRAA